MRNQMGTRHRLWIALFAAAIALAPTTPGATPLMGTMSRDTGRVVLTFESSIRLAMERNPDLVTAYREKEKASAQVAEARSGALPSVGLQAGYTRSWFQQSTVLTVSGEDEEGNPVEETQTITLGQPNAFTAGLSLQQSLFAGGKVRHALKAARIYSERAEQDARSTALAVRYQVSRAFLGALLAREAVDVARQALDQAEANRDQVAARYNQGTASEFDLIRARVRAANLRPPWIEARNRAQRAVEALKQAVGLDMDTTVGLDGDFAVLADFLRGQVIRLRDEQRLRRGTDPEAGLAAGIGVGPAVAIARQSRPELRSLDLQLDLLLEQRAVARGDRLPNVALVGAYGLQWQLPDEWRARSEDVMDNWTTGLTLTMPLFDGGRTRARVKQAEIARLQVASQRRQLADRVHLEVRTALMDLAKAQEQTRAQQETVSQAERGLGIAEVRYGNGLSTQLEVLDAQLALNTARIQYLQALHDYAAALVSVQYTMGYPGVNADRQRD